MRMSVYRWLGVCVFVSLASAFYVVAESQIDMEERHYVRKSAAEKLDYLWQRSERSRLHWFERVAQPGALTILSNMGAAYLSTTFELVSDFMPFQRDKLLHPIGSVVKVDLVPNGTTSQYWSGIFLSGGHGIARLSSATVDGPLAPGIALKILIEGGPSVNVIAAHSLDGQPPEDPGFFANSLCSILPKPQAAPLKVASLLFKLALQRIADAPENERTLPLHEAVSVRADGQTERSPRLAQEICFIPTVAAFQAYADDGTNHDFRQHLAQVPAGTELYQVALREYAGSSYEGVGSVVTRSEIVPSDFGDRRLFFKHPQARFRR